MFASSCVLLFGLLEFLLLLLVFGPEWQMAQGSILAGLIVAVLLGRNRNQRPPSLFAANDRPGPPASLRPPERRLAA